MRPSGGTRGRVHIPSPPMSVPRLSTGTESSDEHDEVRRLALALKLVKLTLGIVASGLTVAKLLGVL
ncbi:hypothetical protein E6P09_13730 [Haloferax mediterranei ATCC 33500]|uniref:Uncharacterized protein n=1 Tax=Haloferax mediterranei (strain ATCC 33500 / DSM 1411 / JCM 8866 / NBRC 14739 / NCIMB 2177 / R-4) TaxID=523841 RepID=A0A4P8P662_HALMT|nr:hypothetical protein [Haloferax mediterranei]MDX5986958.1 hypothetical protein [Haloferax mediterranei ATCC 33500]QCQ76276.1 hypothetical protein E6P09_13730 [Haloferax mediterranei ATCC 33500]